MIKSSQWIRSKIKIKLSNLIYDILDDINHVWYLFEIVCWQVLIRIGRDLLYKCNEVMEKVVDNKELMECIREDSVIYVQIKLL